MRSMTVLSFVLLLAACASKPASEPTAQVLPVRTANYCDPAAVTGSRIKRCDRVGIQTFNREEIEAITNRPTRPGQ